MPTSRAAAVQILNVRKYPALKPLGAALCAALVAGVAAPASATPFTISTPVTKGQSLAAGESGTVTSAGSLTVSGSTVAVAVTGNNAVINNQGTISQTGSGRAIRDNTGVTGLVVTNGSSSNGAATIRTADADVVQMNVPASSVTLNNYGSMISANASAGGAQAVDFSVVTGTNIVNNYAGGLLQASEADAVRPGANGVVNNNGTIRSTTTTGSSSDGIDGQSNSGIVVVNGATGLVDGGRHGITAGQVDANTAFTISVSNAAGGIIRGNDGSGINIDGFNGKQVATVVNNGTIVGNGVTGDGDGVDIDGLANITNTGIIRSTNAVSAPKDGLAYSEGISVGGGTITNSGTIEGLVAAGNTNAVGRGITLAGNDITSGTLAGTREGLYGNATITNQAGGTIRGQSDSAIVASGAASGYTITINNNAGGLIVGGGAASAAILTNGDHTVITNAGTIDGSSSGKAIQMGGGNNSLVISGGNARVLGNIDGGSGHNTMTVDAGAGNAFAYAGAIANFASVEFKSGTTTLSGQNTYTGSTVVSGGVLALVGSGVVSEASALVLAGGTLDLGKSSGQTFASLSLTDDSEIDFGASPLTFDGIGTITDGKTLALVDASDSSGFLLRFVGDLMNDNAFQALMRQISVDNVAVTFSFDGMYTNVIEPAAVPEPGSIALVLGGLGLLGGLRRRQQARAA